VHPEGVPQIVQSDLMETSPAAGRLKGTLRPLVAAERAREDLIRRPGGVGEPVRGQEFGEWFRDRDVADARLGLYALPAADRDPPLGEPHGSPRKSLRLPNTEPGVGKEG
jgi:hypothetical protein